MAPEIAAHEFVHREQFRTGAGRSPANRAELEREADDGARRLLQGQAFSPTYRAPTDIVLGFGAGDAAALIASYTSWGDLDETGLGRRLFDLAWMSPSHYGFVVTVIEELGYGNRDDVAYQFCRHANDANVEKFARTEAGRSMLRRVRLEMQGGWTSEGETYHIARLFAATERQVAGEAGQAAGETVLGAAAERTSDTPTLAGVPVLDAAQVNVRLRLIAAALQRLDTAYSEEEEIITALSTARTNLGSVQTRVSVDTLTELSPLVVGAQSALPQIERGLANLDAIALGTWTAGDYGAQRDASLTLIAQVRTAYVQALAALLSSGGQSAYHRADHMAGGLPRALTEVQLSRLEQGTSVFNIINAGRTDVAEWVVWTRTQLDAFTADARAIGADRQAGREVDAVRIQQFQRQQQLIELSMEGMGHWDRVLHGFEYLNTQGSQFVHLISDQYGAITRMVQRCKAMKAAAMGNDLNTLRSSVNRFTNDEHIERWFNALPIIAGASVMIRSLGITLVAAMASAGVGALFRAGTAGFAAGDAALIVRLGSATSFTSRQVAVFAGSVALEALAFTAVHRGLDQAITGQVHGSGLADLAWNLGLFTMLRLSSLGVQAGMTARGLGAAAAPVQHTVAFGALQAYGSVRFRIERGRWPNSQEFGQMTLETLILMAGIGVATRGMGRYLAAREQAAQFRNLRAFERGYGNEFATLEVDRSNLVGDFRTAIAEGRADDAATRAGFEQRGLDLEQRLNQLMRRVETEGVVDLPALRVEFKRAGFPQLEFSQELLTRSLGLPEEVALRFEGVDGQYSYRFGGTNRLETRLRDIGAWVEKAADPDTGLRSVRVRIPDQEAVTFVERSDPFPAREQHEVDTTHAGFEQMLADFGIADGRQHQYVTWLVQQEMATSQGQMRGAVRTVRRYLTTLRGRANAEGRPFADVLNDISTRGRLSVAHPAEATVADQLDAAGIRTSGMWLDARTEENFSGAVAEMLAFPDAQGRAQTAGHLVLRGVKFRGDMYTDINLTEQHRTGVEVVPEIDQVIVSAQGQQFTIHGLGNVKAFAGRAGAADAAAQNAQSLAALRAHLAGQLPRVTTRDGSVYWVRIAEITGIHPDTGQTIVLTGRLAEQPGGATTETIGPRGAQGYDQTLGVRAREITLIGRILRERSATTQQGF